MERNTQKAKTENFVVEEADKKLLTKEKLDEMYGIEEAENENPYSKDVFQNIIFHETNKTFCCYNHNRLVGFITINTKSKKFGGCLYIVNIVVDKEYQRRGVATKLILKAILTAKEKTQNLIVALEVDKTNLKAINLYKKLGFKFADCDENGEQLVMIATVI